MAETPPAFVCSVSHDIMRDPVVAADGHTYERASIEEWFRINPTSPKTGLRVATHLTPNIALRQAIEEFRAGNEAVRTRLAQLEDMQRRINLGEFERVDRVRRLICPLNHSLMRDPVLAEDGNSYEREFINLYIAGVGDGALVSPVTRRPMGPSLASNDELRREVERYLAEARAEAAPATAEPVESVGDLNHIFDTMDGLTEVLCEVLEGWEPPRVVVVGNQSAGKSTVLERLCMMPLFPRDRRLCTAMPIKIDIRRSPVQRPTTLEVWDTAAAARVGRIRVIPLEGGEVDIRNAMAEALGGAEVSDTHELRVRITSPTLPPMSLVDLPGTVDYPDELRERTHGLVRAQLEASRDRSTYLVVVKADSSGPRNAGPIRHIMALGAADRSIGVFTHCDRLDGDRDHEVLCEWLSNSTDAPDAVPLEPHGWVATMNKELRRASPDETSQARLLRQAQRERRWFEEEGFGPQLEAGRATTRALVAKISAMYGEYVFATFLPTTVGRLGQELLRCSSRRIEIGLPASPGDLRPGRELEALRTAVLERAAALLGPCFDEAIQEYASGTLATLQARLRDSIPEETTVGFRGASDAVAAAAAAAAAACTAAAQGLGGMWREKTERALADDAPPLRLARFPNLLARLRQFCADEQPHLDGAALDAAQQLLPEALAVGSQYVTLMHDFGGDAPTVTVCIDQARLIGVVLDTFAMGFVVPTVDGLIGRLGAAVGEVFDDAAQEREAGHAERVALVDREARVARATRGLLRLVDPELPLESEQPIVDTITAVLPNLPADMLTVALAQCTAAGDGLQGPVSSGTEVNFTIVTADAQGRQLATGGLPFEAAVRAVGMPARAAHAAIVDNGDGTYTGRYTLERDDVAAAVDATESEDGSAQFECAVTLYGLPLPGSPFGFMARAEVPVQIQLWGAGGAGGEYSRGNHGGAGGYVGGTLQLEEDQELVLVVGGGGRTHSHGAASGGFSTPEGAGFPNGGNGFGNYDSGGGGGSTHLLSGTLVIAAAGGGGGGSGGENCGSGGGGGGGATGARLGAGGDGAYSSNPTQGTHGGGDGGDGHGSLSFPYAGASHNGAGGGCGNGGGGNGGGGGQASTHGLEPSTVTIIDATNATAPNLDARHLPAAMRATIAAGGNHGRNPGRDGYAMLTLPDGRIAHFIRGEHRITRAGLSAAAR